MQDAHLSPDLHALHGAVLDLVAIMNAPARDELLIREAGIGLETPLFSLLVLIGRFGPIGVVALADRVGRDYTTVSRQLGRLEQGGLIERTPSRADRRRHEACITVKGKAMTNAIDTARDRLLQAGFAEWQNVEVAELGRLLRRFVDSLEAAQRPRSD